MLFRLRSNKELFGTSMVNWPTKKLSDLLETCDAGVWGKLAIKGKGLFVLRSTNMTNDGHLDFSDVAERKIENDIKKIKLLDGDILVEKSGGGPDQPVGRVTYFVAPDGQSYSFANFIQRLRVKSDLIDSRFLFYRLLFLYKIGFTKKLQSQTTGIRNLKLSLYLKTEIPTPPRPIQKQIVERLDKIAEAQKLNDDLIQKSDELFQSLLHKELNPGDKNWEMKKLKEILSNEKCSVGKLKRERYQKSGTYQIIDQSVNEIAGYSENKEVVYSGKLPVVIYGDHTRIVKFVEHKFILGADGTKILIPKDEVLAQYLYFVIQLFNVESHGYKRHFPILKEIKIPLPPLETQKQIVAKLSAVQGYKTQLIAQKAKLKELFDSVLARSFK